MDFHSKVFSFYENYIKIFFAIFQLPFNWIEKNKDKRADKYVLEKEKSENLLQVGSCSSWLIRFLIKQENYTPL